MPKRGENIHKRKDGRWEGRIRIKSSDSVPAKCLSVYGRTYSEVKEKLLYTQLDIYNASKEVKTPHKFSDVLDMWLRINRLKFKGATEHKYNYLIQHHILPELGDIDVKAINALKLHEFMEQKLENGRLDRKGGLSKSYVRTIMIITLSALKYAATENLCEPLKNPVYKPTADKKELKILSPREQRDLVLFLTHNITPTNLGILLSLFSGLRIGEVCALKWEDVDLVNKILHVRATIVRIKNPIPDANPRTLTVIDLPKTRTSIRDIPIHSTLLPVLSKAQATAVSPYIVSDKDSFICPRTFEYRYHQVLGQCISGKYNYHALRHTFATRCIEAGMDVKTLSEILGHSEVSITLNTYVHSSMELKKRQIEKLSALDFSNL